MKHINLFVLALIFGTLTACGGGGDGYGGDTPAEEETPPPAGEEIVLPPPGEISADYTISISIPQTDAISKLPDEAAGVYSLIGTLTVTDRNGNPVPTGTVVHLDIIDTIKAIGTIDHTNAAENITASTLIDSNPTLADDTPRTFETAFVMRDGSPRMIGANDLVLLTNNAFQTDMNRFVSSAAGSITGDTITVSTSYSANYEASIFADLAYFNPQETSYLIGSSEVGIKIHGIDPEDATVTTPALTRTDINGIGKFRIEYPANSGTIHLGCGITDIDERFLNYITDLPDKAGDVYMVARLDGNDAVTTIEHNQVCYQSILPWSMTLTPSVTIVGNVTNAPFVLHVEDAEGIELPYIDVKNIRAVTTDTDSSITTFSATECTTSHTGSGACTVTITLTGANSGDAGEVTFYSDNNVSATVPFKIP